MTWKAMLRALLKQPLAVMTVLVRGFWDLVYCQARAMSWPELYPEDMPDVEVARIARMSPRAFAQAVECGELLAGHFRNE